MTALPKHWPSSRRQGRRRASIKAPLLAQVTACKNCGQPKVPGFTCKNCNK
ncbi:TPA: 50S ribosomal protein L32 [Candidatus Shapirobacteria bacterium]|nr:50S ribosomal protein L32 [Candidatus Shapirobacteria bacterium]